MIGLIIIVLILCVLFSFLRFLSMNEHYHIFRKERKIMSAITDLTLAVEALQTTDAAVVAAIVALKGQVAALQDAINNAGNDPAVVAAAEAVNAEVSKLAAAIA